MSFEALRALIIASGYELRFRDGEWVECLLLREEEAWIGRGRDRAVALHAAVQRACPSALARELLNVRLDRMSAEAAAASAEHREKLLDAIASAAPDAPTVEMAPISMPPVTPLPPISTPPPDAPIMRTPLPYDRVRATPRIYAAPPPLVRRDSVPTRIVDPPRALEELDILLERVRESRDELGLCSPERQRLAMLAWICEARAHTDTFPDDARIRERVGTISRQLTEIGKTFWPGSVTALQLQMQPRDLPRHVLGGPAPTWSRAAELSERALHSLEYSDERRGFDAYGWADAQHVTPVPPNPNEHLEEIVREIETCAGALVPHAVPRETETRPDPELYKKWVRTLRWLRLADVDPERWARVAGRLRWWATHRDEKLAASARELEAAFAPEHPWADALGFSAVQANGTPLETGLLDAVREMTSGKRVVFVSNRRDPDLEVRLKDLLPEAALEWRVAEPKRLEALGDSIQQGAFDVVLGAIGFQSLTTDHLLARACKQAKIKYLRVNRGRPTACLRALSRS
jgi:hypothetical protein